MIVGGFDHGDADDDGRECLAVGDVDLDAAAGSVGPFLECRAKEDVAKFHAGKVESCRVRGPNRTDR